MSPCPATVTVHDDHWGAWVSGCELDAGHEGDHRSARTACEPAAYLGRDDERSDMKVWYYADSGVYGYWTEARDGCQRDGFGDVNSTVEIPDELWERYRAASAAERAADEEIRRVADNHGGRN